MEVGKDKYFEIQMKNFHYFFQFYKIMSPSRYLESAETLCKGLVLLLSVGCLGPYFAVFTILQFFFGFQVTNTPWGERVSFVFDPHSDLVAKALHVSPFMVCKFLLLLRIKELRHYVYGSLNYYLFNIVVFYPD